MKTRYDQGVTGRTFDAGQAVMLKHISNKQARKELAATWRGPSIVTGFRGEHQILYTLR